MAVYLLYFSQWAREVGSRGNDAIVALSTDYHSLEIEKYVRMEDDEEQEERGSMRR